MEKTLKPIRCKAAVCRVAGEPLVLEEVEVAPPKAFEVRIKIICTSVCHTDLSFMRLKEFTPIILGHESVGVVESVGEGVVEVVVGDRVVPMFQPNCGECGVCRSNKSNLCAAVPSRIVGMPRDGNSRITDGGGAVLGNLFGISSFSEYTVVDVACIIKLEAGMPSDKACILSCGISTGLGAAWKVGDVEAGSTVVIFGLGTVGLAMSGEEQLNRVKSPIKKIFGRRRKPTTPSPVPSLHITSTVPSPTVTPSPVLHTAPSGYYLYPSPPFLDPNATQYFHIPQPTPSSHPLPSSDPSPRSQPSPSSQHMQNVDEEPSEHRLLIEPDGDTFNPPRRPVSKIVDIIKSKYDHPYVSWKKIPSGVRDMWFQEFEKSFNWMPHHNDQIRRNFEIRGSTRLRDMFTDIRKSKKGRPDWIGEGVWSGLCAEWGNPDYVKKREQAKMNRASDCGGQGSSLHTGGSIPHTEHRRRLKKILDREPTPGELHEATHQRKADKSWVDERASKNYAEYIRLTETVRSSSVGESSSGPVDQVADYDLWTQAVGGPKKGRLYGLGSQGLAHTKARSSCSSSSYSYPESIEAIVKKQMEEYKTSMKKDVEAQIAQAIKATMDLYNKKGRDDDIEGAGEGDASDED